MIQHGQIRKQLLERIREAMLWDKLFGKVPKDEIEKERIRLQIKADTSYSELISLFGFTPNEIEEETIRLMTPVSPKQNY